ncbi:acyltransferase family protein [Jidongwangia harbinensis]|uniref:acyltransferase family protein n=1 Tax=Jidongwangia harbinensis TaxID=2878561 RepID=UPI001CD94900|nr:acyltransferase [Jidongwangia harbinensis]MCA2219455.1 acyltransferase [Jidongwangia harbinensis]
MTATLPAPPRAADGPGRLGWLDALRGYAALVVVLFHLSPTVLGPERHLAVFRTVDLGKYGVLLFFLVSGYVIPMSLERHGSLRRFWVGRLCRIYPAYLVTLAVVAVLAAAGLTTVRLEPVTGALAHATMLSDLLGVRGVVRVFWTLSYEMTFYLVVAGLYAWRGHRHSGWWAAGLAVTALLAGPLLPDGLLSSGPAGRRLAAAVLLVVLVAGVAAYLTGRRTAALAAGACGIGFLLLPAVNGHAGPRSTVIASWQGLLLLAVMFAGTVVYRAQHRQLGRVPAVLALAVVAGCVVGAHRAHLASPAAHRVWLLTTVAVVATFGLAFALRRRAVPGVLVRLGTVSYSLYLLHVVVLQVAHRAVPGLADRPAAVRIAVAAAVLVVALGVAGLSYRVVERPAQALGRRVQRRFEPGDRPRIATQRAATRTGGRQNRPGSV